MAEIDYRLIGYLVAYFHDSIALNLSRTELSPINMVKKALEESSLDYDKIVEHIPSHNDRAIAIAMDISHGIYKKEKPDGTLEDFEQFWLRTNIKEYNEAVDKAKSMLKPELTLKDLL